MVFCKILTCFHNVYVYEGINIRPQKQPKITWNSAKESE